ncbi:hypothetical protein N9063_00840 [Deltaproteobacteria bacterium]|nr:hypothetical protein [Deltaproteobacteria bacterium]
MPIDISLRYSRLLQVYSCALLLLTTLALLRLPLSLPVLLLLALLLFLYGHHGLRQYLAVESPARITRLSFLREQWFLEVAGEQLPVELTQATVWQSLVALNFRHSQSKQARRVVLLADSCDPDELRKLRVLLRHFPVLAR